MSKLTFPSSAMAYCGIDVAAATLSVAVQRPDRPVQQRAFANSASGHKALIVWLGKQNSRVRVSLEATGIYSLDLALALERAESIEVAVLNPKKVKGFAQSMQRSKTDKADARLLAEYSLRMPFVAWQAPSREGFQLRGICRHITALGAEHTRTLNRLAAARGAAATPRCVSGDLKRALAGLKKRMATLRRQAMKLIEGDPQLAEKVRLMTSIPGIASISALQILGELVLLAPDAEARQWVAHSGLDPVHEDSGSSVHKPARISRAGSRFLRRALYMPALTAAGRDPHLKAFYEALQARHKTKLQALMAVARKILHAIYGIFKSGTPYDGQKLFPQLRIPCAVQSTSK